MKRFILLMILLMVTSVTMGATFTVVTPGASDTTVISEETKVPLSTAGLADLSVTTGKIANGAVTPAKTTDIYSKTEVDSLTAGSSQEPYYTQEEASDIAGFEALAIVATSTQTSEPLAALGLTYALADKHLTPAGYPNLATRVKGIYNIVGFYSKTGSGQAVIAYEWWTRTTAGVETFLASSTETILDGTLTKQQINPFISLNADVTGIPTSNRDILKIYVKRVGTAALTRWYGDGTSGHFNIQVPSSVVMRTDASNAAAGALTALGGASLNGSSTVNFKAERMDTTLNMSFADEDRGPITVAFFTPTLSAGASATYTITKTGTNIFSFLITTSMTYYSGGGVTSDGKIVTSSGGIAINGSVTNLTSTVLHPGSWGASTTVEILGNGVDATDIVIRFTNKTAVALSSVICKCDLVVLRGDEFNKE